MTTIESEVIFTVRKTGKNTFDVSAVHVNCDIYAEREELGDCGVEMLWWCSWVQVGMHGGDEFLILSLSSCAIIKADKIGGVKNIIYWGRGYVFHSFHVCAIFVREQDSGVSQERFWERVSEVSPEASYHGAIILYVFGEEGKGVMGFVEAV